MSDTRRPFFNVLMRAKGVTTKIEVFEGSLFSLRRATDIVGNRIPKESVADYVRLRINGKWFPAKTTTLYTREQLHSIIVRFANP